VKHTIIPDFTATLNELLKVAVKSGIIYFATPKGTRRYPISFFSFFERRKKRNTRMDLEQLRQEHKV
jgi:hypothetical protein